ncbi:MAG: hypothetical protein LBQ44_00460 [Treponema sp.]|jgi:hypothetical protein|nr:hypothetical protein [Treponema sp.]
MKNTKRVFMVLLIGLLCAGAASAHGHGRGRDRDRGRGPGPRFTAEALTVSGNLQLVDGHIAVVSNGVNYYTPGLHRLVGFVDGFKEGAAVRLEGRAGAAPPDAGARFLWVTKLTLNGRDYAFPAPEQRWREHGRPRR